MPGKGKRGRPGAKAVAPEPRARGGSRRVQGQAGGHEDGGGGRAQSDDGLVGLRGSPGDVVPVRPLHPWEITARARDSIHSPTGLSFSSRRGGRLVGRELAAGFQFDGHFRQRICWRRVYGEGVEVALPAAVGEQGEGGCIPGGGCASHHLRSAKVLFLYVVQGRAD